MCLKSSDQINKTNIGSASISICCSTRVEVIILKVDSHLEIDLAIAFTNFDEIIEKYMAYSMYYDMVSPDLYSITIQSIEK